MRTTRFLSTPRCHCLLFNKWKNKTDIVKVKRNRKINRREPTNKCVLYYCHRVFVCKCVMYYCHRVFVCKCVLYYCHRVSTQLQLTKLSIRQRGRKRRRKGRITIEHKTKNAKSRKIRRKRMQGTKHE
jgi:hypothetical protein